MPWKILKLSPNNLRLYAGLGCVDSKFAQYKLRVATVREKCLENEIFSKSGNYVDGQ